MVVEEQCWNTEYGSEIFIAAYQGMHVIDETATYMADLGISASNPINPFPSFTRPRSFLEHPLQWIP
jgi:hypothetical protein